MAFVSSIVRIKATTMTTLAIAIIKAIHDDDSDRDDHSNDDDDHDVGRRRSTDLEITNGTAAAATNEFLNQPLDTQNVERRS